MLNSEGRPLSQDGFHLPISKGIVSLVKLPNASLSLVLLEVIGMGDSIDVNLACDDEQIRAHKMNLSS